MCIRREQQCNSTIFDGLEFDKFPIRMKSTVVLRANYHIIRRSVIHEGRGPG